MSATYLRLGDVIRNSGTIYIIDRITESGARGTPLSRKARVIHDKLNDKTKTIEETGRPQRFSVLTEEEYVLERRGRDGLAAFQAGARAARAPGTDNNAAAGNNGEDMRKKKAGNKEGAAERKGGLGEIMGHSVGSVLKRLGVEDVTAAHALEILRAQGIKVPTDEAGLKTMRNTVAWNITAGKSGRGKVAELTKAQVAELVASAPEPAKEQKPEPKPRAKKGGKGGSKPKAKAKAEDAPAGPSATQAVYGVESVASTKP